MPLLACLQRLVYSNLTFLIASFCRKFSLVHNAKYPSSFNSERWKAEYNPNIAFVNQTIGSFGRKGVLDSIPRTQHRPISVSVHAAVTSTIVPH